MTKQLMITDIDEKPFLTIPMDVPENLQPMEVEMLSDILKSAIRDALFDFINDRKFREQMDWKAKVKKDEKHIDK